jgi:hypothetical protein
MISLENLSRTESEELAAAIAEAERRGLDLSFFDGDKPKKESPEAVNEENTFSKQYWDAFDRFILECFHWREGEGPTFYQLEGARDLVAKKRIAWRGPHGLGKTAWLSWLILWFALTRDEAGIDWKIPTTAGAWRQLTKFLWPEVHKWARRLKWDIIGRAPFHPVYELQQLSLKLTFGEAFAAASDNPDLIEGAHADQLLYVFDESKAISDATFDAAEGAFSNSGVTATTQSFAVAMSTPGEPQGRFYNIHSRKPGFEDWSVRHITFAEVLQAGRATLEWANQRKKQWGAKSALYENKVLGEFAANDEDGIIPLGWIELANERWHNWVESDKPGDFTGVGVDVADSGGDDTVLALRYGSVIGEIRRYSKGDTMQTVGRVAGVLNGQAGASSQSYAIVDVIGVGAGVVSRLREQRYNVQAFHASEGTKALDRSRELGFINRRAHGWWNLRELLDPENGHEVALPPDELLTGDLTAPHWWETSKGLIQVEGKPEIKTRLGRSTDTGDAVMMAFYHDTTSGSNRAYTLEDLEAMGY